MIEGVMQWTDRVLVDVHLQLTHKPVITVAIVMMAGDSKVTMPNARKGERGSMIGRTLLGCGVV